MGAVLTFLSTLFVFSVVNGTPLLYGTLGEILTEKSGNMNLGVEGILFMGGAAGLGGAFYYEKLAGANASPFVALLLAVFFAFLAGALASLLFSFITITLRANQNVTGLALTIFGTGAGQFLGEYMRVQEGSYVSLSNNLKAIFVNSPFPAFLRNIPVLGPLLFQHNILTYFALALAVFLAWFLNKTRKGLYLRAVGESPASAKIPPRLTLPVSTSPATNTWPPCWAAASPPSAALPTSPASQAACGTTRACPASAGWLSRSSSSACGSRPQPSGAASCSAACRTCTCA